MKRWKIDADHSGPNFEFSGEISEQFERRLFEWARVAVKQAHTREQHDEHPDMVCMNKDGKKELAEWHWDGENINTITICKDGDKLDVQVYGDGHEVGMLPFYMIKIGKCRVEDGDAFGIIDGKKCTLDELQAHLAAVQTLLKNTPQVKLRGGEPAFGKSWRVEQVDRREK